MLNIDKTLYSTRPNDSRQAKELRVYELLEALDIQYHRVDHDEAATIDECLEIESVLGTKICKNLFLCNQQKTKFYLLMMPGDKHFSTKEFSKKIGSSRLSFAPPEFMERYLNLTPGSVSFLGLMNDCDNNVTLVIDKDVTADESIGCHPCINTSTLKLKTSDILKHILPTIHHEPIFVELNGEI